MPRDARITDVCDHGPTIVTGSATVIDEGQPTSRIGDIYDCPVHGPNPIITGSHNTIVDGAKTSKIGDVTECGAVIITGAQKCEVN